MSQKDEFQKFDSMMRQLIKVPHSKIKAKLEAERAEKKANDTKRSGRSGGENRS